MSEHCVTILIAGAAQGCGVRPEMARLARRHGWSGTVRNTNAGVELILSGALPDDQELSRLVEQTIPVQAFIEKLYASTETAPRHHEFMIEESTATGIVSTPVPRDVGICADCLAESRDPLNRRYRYPFINCASCGPRYCILRSMPFDRSRTTMSTFSLCARCTEEYQDPADRRFHAQTICCPDCGPQIWASDHRNTRVASGDDAIRRCAEAIINGQTVAMRGIGGYQLLADATNSTAVSRLRRRKRRPDKPFAVMCRSLPDVQALASLSEGETAQLIAAYNPIVLLRQRLDSGICPEINPGLNELGVFLPSTAMHDRLLELAGRPLVCTSGNTNGNPIAFEINEACQYLGEVADLFIHHNREISRPIDDSVIRVIAGRPVTLRCGRGLAPVHLGIKGQRGLIAVGGQLKSSIAASNGEVSWLGPHIGDLDLVSVQERWIGQLEFADQLMAPRSCEMEGKPQRHHFVHDAHPDFFSTSWCSAHADKRKTVWHHHAHVVSAMLEHGWLDRTILGIAFDGTGLGPDGMIWGSEFLIASATHFQRVGHLRPFALPGGDAAIVDSRRILWSLLSQLEGLSEEVVLKLTRLAAADVSLYRKVLRMPTTNWTTSCGRLFDAVARLLLDDDHPTYDGQSAMRLECCCNRTAEGEYSFASDVTSLTQIDWRPVLMQIITDQRQGIPIGTIAKRFHYGLARAIVDLCQRYQNLPVVLSGGVFQNRILVERILEIWPEDGAPLGLPGVIPPNDGGLAAGQLTIATMLNSEKDD